MNNKRPIRLFYSYSHIDESLRDELEKHLKSLQREDYIEPWHDRKITPGDEWKKQIDDNLENAEIILLLISADFIASDYCYDLEMGKALSLHDEGKAVVIPIILRECNWQIAKFSNLQAIPTDGKAVTSAAWHNNDQAFTVIAKQLQQKIEYIWRENEKKSEQSILDALNNDAKKPIQIRLKNIPVVKNYFTGRNEKLKELKEAFDHNPFILIEGGGGIGKTQLVSKFITNEKLKDRTVWFSCEPTSQPDDIIRGAGFEEILKGENKPEREKFSAFKDKIEEYNLVVFLDNYQEVEGKENFKSFLWFINEYLSKGHVIIIGRDNIAGISSVQPKRLHITGLGADSLQHAKGAMNHLYPDIIVSDGILQNICDTLQGYPLAIDLAINLLSQNTPPGQIIEAAIKNAKEGNTTIEEMVERLLNEIFTRQDATGEEKDFLKLFSVFRGKVETAAARAVIPVAIFDRASQRLKYKNILNIQDDFHEVHPLIREFSYDKLQEKEETHVKAADFYKTLRASKFNPELEEKIYSHQVAGNEWEDIKQTIVNAGRDFILFGYLDQIQQMIVEVKVHNISLDIFDILQGDIAEIKGNWIDAITFFKQAKNSADEKIKIEGTIKHGEMLHRMGNIKEAKIIYEQIIKKTENSVELKEWYARAINDLGLVLDSTGSDLKEALRLLNLSLYIRKELNLSDDIATTILNIANVKKRTGKYHEALELVEKSLGMWNLIGNKDGLGKALLQIGEIKDYLKEKEAAMNYYKESLNIQYEIGSKNGISATLNNMAILLGEKGKKADEYRYYEECLRMDEEIGNKEGMAIRLFNMGTWCVRNNEAMDQCCSYLIKSIALEKLIGKKSTSDQMLWLYDVKQKKGFAFFKERVTKAYNELDESLQKQVDIHEILGEPRKAEQKVGRNDDCPCGSGKKYKNCHGRTQA